MTKAHKFPAVYLTVQRRNCIGYKMWGVGIDPLLTNCANIPCSEINHVCWKFLNINFHEFLLQEYLASLHCAGLKSGVK